MPSTTRTKPRTRKQREAWGQVEKLPSGRVRVRYTGPDLNLHKPTSTFPTLMEAREWLTSERRRIDAGTWTPPHLRKQAEQEEAGTTLADFAETWLKLRRNPKSNQELKPRTRALYRTLLDQKILPSLGALPLPLITEDIVEKWYADMDPALPTRRYHAYSLLRAMMNSAVRKKKIPATPCTIEGAGTPPSAAIDIVPATAVELQAILDRLPARYRVMTLMAVWCSGRFGELIELRRKDFDLAAGVVHIRRSAGKVPAVPGEPSNRVWVITEPKSKAGRRTVSIPAFLIPELEKHMAEFSQWGPEGLVFPAQMGEHIGHGGFQRTYNAARVVAGRPDLRFHDLRHTGSVLMAISGATLVELMEHNGHADHLMAMRYQHVAKGRKAELAAKMNELAMAGGF